MRAMGATFIARIRTVLEMIKFSHSIFSIPFALCGAWLAARGVPELLDLVWIVLCAVTARSAAMGANRLVDRKIDARNPRTSGRALPAGLLQPRFVLVFVVANAALFLLFAGLLNELCFWLSPLVLAILIAYSWFKRFTQWAHLMLGLALGLAPMGAWLAVRGQLDGEIGIPLLLGALVLTWVSGFDIIYSCQDVDCDRRDRLHSVPARWGIRGALWISTGLHGLTALLCILVGVAAGLSLVYAGGAALMIALLVYQHWIVRPDDLSRVNMAFFTANGWAGLMFFAATAVDLGGW